MIETLPYPKWLYQPPNPALGIIERALLDCGCHVWVGARMDNQELATAAISCSPDHNQLMTHFNLLLKESLVEPQDELLVIVCERLLDEAERHYLGS
jgi:hypothetical protein